MIPQPPPPPAADVPSEASRRIYFEQLSAALLAKGFDGSRIGLLVAELDEHVVTMRADPVRELGSVGEFAAALAAADSDRRPGRWLLGHVVIGLAVGTVAALIVGLQFGRQPGDAIVIHAGLIPYLGVFMFGIGLLRLFGSNTIVGNSRFQLPPMKYFLTYVAITTLAWVAFNPSAATGGPLPTVDLEWVATWRQVLFLLAVAVPTAVVAIVWSIRRSRISVPGRLRHLRRLEWGMFGR